MSSNSSTDAGGLGSLAALPPLVATLLYLPSLSHAPVFDDHSLIVNNPFLSSASSLLELWTRDLWSASGQFLSTQYYRPLPMTSYWLQIWLGGTDVRWLRLGNVAILAGTGWALARLLHRQFPKLTPALVTALACAWVVHPINTEPTLWLSGRFDLFLGLFCTLALGVNLGRTRFASVPLLVSCALVSKEVGVCLLPVLGAQDVLNGRAWKSEWPKYAWLALATGGYLLVRSALGIAGAPAVVVETGIRSLAMSLVQLVSTYGQLLLWPLGFDVFHWYAPGSLRQLLFLVGIAGSLAFTLLRRLGRSSLSCLPGATLVLSALVPAAAIGPNQHVFGDRFGYLPWLGLVLLIAPALQSVRIKRLAPLVALVAAACLAWIPFTLARALEWKSEDSLTEAALHQKPQHPHWLVLKAHSLLKQGASNEAEALLLESTSTFPRYGKAWNALCVAQSRANRPSEAIRSCLRASGLMPDNPSAWVNLATARAHARQWGNSLTAATQAVTLRSPYPEAEYLIAVSQANLGNLKLAHHYVNLGLSHHPKHAALLALQEQLAERAETN